MTEKQPFENQEQSASPSYLLPAKDLDFLLGDSMRAVRFQLEYAKAEEILRKWRVRSTLVCFGSARFKPDSSNKDHARWYNAARDFGRIVSERGGANHIDNNFRDNVIATGGGPGIMEAANRGAHDAGAPSIGYNIVLPFEQEPNAYSTPDLTFSFHYFAMRKMHLAMRANAMAVFPGGFGTLDEMFEILTLIQTEKAPKIPVILFDKAFWTSIINFEAIAEAGTISPEDLDLFDYADSAEEAWDKLKDKVKYSQNHAHVLDF